MKNKICDLTFKTLTSETLNPRRFCDEFCQNGWAVWGLGLLSCFLPCNAMLAWRMLLSCVSVRHTPVLYQNG